MSENFFKTYYPLAEFLSCSDRSQQFVKLIQDQGLFLDLGVACGTNIKNFQQAGWDGKIVGLADNEVMATLPNVLESIDTISLLSINLDKDLSIASLDMCCDKLKNSYIYLDEFHGFDNWQSGLANSAAIWFALNIESFDIAFYTDNGLAIKVGGPYTADNLMLNLLEYTTEKI
jgi:hypothetical protein